MAFINVGSLDAQGAPVLRKSILTNSIVTTVSDSVKVTSGFAALGTTGALVFGHVVSIVDKNGMPLLTTGAAGAEIGSYVGTWTAASDNQTVAQVSAICDISKNTLYSATSDAALGTTTGSNLAMYHTDLLDEDDLDESAAVTATAQYTIHGVRAGSTTLVEVSIYESQVFGV